MCKYCERLMHPGRNICQTGICVCGEDMNTHSAWGNHSPVDSAEYLEMECEADEETND